MPCFNTFRKGLTLFVIYTRDGHAKGFIWAGTSHAALGRADRIAGSGSFVEYAGV